MIGTPAKAQNVLFKERIQRINHCHMKFPAIRPETLGAHPELLPPDTTDLVDFYGSCDYDPLGPEEIYRQTWQRELELNEGR